MNEFLPKVAADIIPGNGKILSVVLGASRFEGLPGVESDEASAAFLQSKLEFAEYATTISSKVLDKFDSDDLPDRLCLDIVKFLTSENSATDLIVYYVGHGGFMSNAAEHSEYFLALKTTTEAEKFVTGLRVNDLALAIRKAARLRAIIILDCCYAGKAVQYFTGGDPIADRSSRIPFGLTLFTASPSHQEAVVPLGGKRTMFSGCLLDVLKNGIADKGPLLSINEIAVQVRLLIEQSYPDDGVRPEVHSPRQRYGDVADQALFPNVAFLSRLKPGETDAIPKVPPTAPTSQQKGALGFFFVDGGLVRSSGIAVLACTVIENPDAVRKEVENARRIVINSPVLSLGSDVQERLRKVGFDYLIDDSDVRAKFIATIATLTYEAYICAADVAYFKETSEERIFCELFGRLLFDRISKHKSERIEIFLRDERAGLLDALQGVVTSCVHNIDSTRRGEVRYLPVIRMIKPRDGCIELAQYVAGVVGQRLGTGVSARKDRRDYRRIASKVRLIRRLDTGEYFNRHFPLKDD